MWHISWCMKARRELARSAWRHYGSIPFIGAHQDGKVLMCLCSTLLFGGHITKQMMGEGWLMWSNEYSSCSKWNKVHYSIFLFPVTLQRNPSTWWLHICCRVNFYQEGDHVHPYLDASTAFQRALTTWASWVDRYINPQQTRVFFRSTSPSHFWFALLLFSPTGTTWQLLLSPLWSIWL